MRIAYIAAGAANMYCGSCLHDNALAAALQRQGHDVALIPTYTPTRTDEVNVSINRIFFGGINIFLQQKYAIFRHSPGFFDRLLDQPALLNWLSRMSGATDAKDLGALTISMLEGESGNFKKELDKLTVWLRDTLKPDLIQLTNSMFAGMARHLKQEVGTPVLCAMQGEDIFLDGLPEPYRAQAMTLLRERAADIDGFIATGDYYSEFMATYLKVAPEKIHKVKLGINLDGFEASSLPPRDEDPFVIGYLARICPEKGLHLLVEAFHQLRKQTDRKLQLRVAGYLGKRDQPYFEGIQKKIKRWGFAEAFEYLGEVDRPGKIDFLQRIHLLAVPTVYRESKGLFALEAMASGVPVVQPNHGTFPEMIQATGGGILVEPNSVEALVEGIFALMNNPDQRSNLAQRGHASVHQHFGDEIMAAATLQVYRQYSPFSHAESGDLQKARNP